MTNDRPIHRLKYQWQASIHFNLPMVVQYDVIFKGTTKSFFADIKNLQDPRDTVKMSQSLLARLCKSINPKW